MIEKIVPTDMFVLMFDEPSNGSNADADRRTRIQNIQIRHFLGGKRCDRQLAESVADNLIGANIKILLNVPVGVATLCLSGDPGQRSAAGQIGNIDRSPRKRSYCFLHCLAERIRSPPRHPSFAAVSALGSFKLPLGRNLQTADLPLSRASRELTRCM